MKSPSISLGRFSAFYSVLCNRGCSNFLRRASTDAKTFPGNFKPNATRSRWKTIRNTLFGVTGLSLAYYGYRVHRFKNPAVEQPEADPDKKTLVVLGSGWGAISLLRTLDTSQYNVIVVSPRNYFLFTSLLPSTATGAVQTRSIITPTRYLLRHKSNKVRFIRSECTDIDPSSKVLKIRSAVTTDDKQIEEELKYDYLVFSIGADVQTFGIPGVLENGCQLKEVWDAQKIRAHVLRCLEQASLPGLSPEERKRYLHTVVVGGGPTGMEFSAEMGDFIRHDLKKWYPDLADDFQVTLLEALPSVLPMFTEKGRMYAVKHFADSGINIQTRTALKEATKEELHVEVTDDQGNKTKKTIPYGLLVWAGGNKPRQLTQSLISSLPEQTNRRGLMIDDFMQVKGLKDVWAIGDCTTTQFAATAQVAEQQGIYLGQQLNKLARLTFKDVESLQQTPVIQNLSAHGLPAFYFWRATYLSELDTIRNRTNVAFDWMRINMFGRDISSL
ncbi:NADH dehydrogenase [Schizosaccharomyces japonicus yFS275]|uniref:NADH:ubiquinone reductase (non-electrogenic) n=1 Tax=Schizosaccharomyces japonicus (strain yFS275 / FY16936) TaxID=402676 RepID=B6JY80_SCHJY|nr:NADH dehydrogenase [Schizosaccharomyces japonicus yFS275]EEB06498.1 NADH dehydrogenase [Schizosaccharomyces japonicus yFS275]